MGRSCKEWSKVPDVFVVYMREEDAESVDHADEEDGEREDRLQATVGPRPSGLPHDRTARDADVWFDRENRRRLAMARAQRRRAQRIRVGGKEVTAAERQAVFEAFSGVCVYCATRRPTTLDHIVPIAWFGKDEVSNVLPSCWTCNSGKRAKTFGAWVERWKPEEQAAILERIARGRERLRDAGFLKGQ